MFTGLIEHIGEVGQVAHLGDTLRITIDCAEMDFSDVVLGESIAVDGACMTVVRFDSHSFDFEASPESLARTTLGDLERGTRVHLERAMVLGGRLGGHLVQGHVDGVGTLVDVAQDLHSWRLTFHAPPAVSLYLVEKGSITISGVSLTVNSVDAGGNFTVTIVPHTSKHTRLVSIRPGARVNLEADVIGKYVRRLMAAGEGGVYTGDGVTHELLAEAGFISNGE